MERTRTSKEYADLKEKNFNLYSDDYIAYREVKASFLEKMEQEAYRWYEIRTKNNKAGRINE